MEEPKNVWEWLDYKGYKHLPFHDGYQSSCGFYFISNTVLWSHPGEVIYYLKTGYLRNYNIFNNTWTAQPTETPGYRRHKDGTNVRIGKVK